MQGPFYSYAGHPLKFLDEASSARWAVGISGFSPARCLLAQGRAALPQTRILHGSLLCFCPVQEIPGVAVNIRL